MRFLTGSTAVNSAVSIEPERQEALHTQDKRITVTGGKGFLGSHLVRKLQERGYTQIFSVDHYENLMMGTQLFHEGFLRKIEKFVGVATICAYSNPK